MKPSTRYILAGLEAGISGSIGMLSWLLLQSRFFGRSIWWAPNLLASLFYGEQSLKHGFGVNTLAGFALVIFACGTLGVLFGLIWRDRAGGIGILFCSLLFATAAYLLLIAVVWRKLNPAGSYYSSDRQLFIGFLLYGVLLARYSLFRARMVYPGG